MADLPALPGVFLDPSRMEGVVVAIERMDQSILRLANHLTGVARDVDDLERKTERAGRTAKTSVERTTEALEDQEETIDDLIKKSGRLNQAYEKFGRKFSEVQKKIAQSRKDGGSRMLSVGGPHSIQNAMRGNFRNLMTSMRGLGGGLIGPGGIAGFLLYGMAGKERFRAEVAKTALAFQRIGAANARGMAGRMQTQSFRVGAALGEQARLQYLGSAQAAGAAGFTGDSPAERRGPSSGIFGRGTIARAAALDSVLGRQMGQTMTELGEVTSTTGESFSSLSHEFVNTLALSQMTNISFDRIKQSLSSSIGPLGLMMQSYKGLQRILAGVSKGFEEMLLKQGKTRKQSRRMGGEMGMRGVQGLASGVAGAGPDDIAFMLESEGKIGRGQDFLSAYADFKLGEDGGDVVKRYAKAFGNLALKGVGPQRAGEDKDAYHKRAAGHLMMLKPGLGPQGALSAVKIASGKFSDIDLSKVKQGTKSPQERLIEGIGLVKQGVDRVAALLERIQKALLHLAVATIEGMKTIGYGIMSVMTMGDKSNFYKAKAYKSALGSTKHFDAATAYAGEAFNALGGLGGFELYQDKTAKETSEAVTKNTTTGEIYDVDGDGKETEKDREILEAINQQILYNYGSKGDSVDIGTKGLMEGGAQHALEQGKILQGGMAASRYARETFTRLAQGATWKGKPLHVGFHESGDMIFKVQIIAEPNPRAEKK